MDVPLSLCDGRNIIRYSNEPRVGRYFIYALNVQYRRKHRITVTILRARGEM